MGKQTNHLMLIQHCFERYIWSFMKFYDPSLSKDHPENFYMEREWRMYGALNFILDDVVRITLPRSFKEQFRADFPGYRKKLTLL